MPGRYALALDGTDLPLPRSDFAWMQLRCRGNEVAGDVRASVAELPLENSGVSVVVLRHALEMCADAEGLMHEALRVLAPGGLLLVAAIHPLSLWHPWLGRRAREAGQHFTPHMPQRWCSRCVDAGVEVESVQRIGRTVPWRARRETDFRDGVMGAAFLLQARKRRSTGNALRDLPQHRARAAAPATTRAGAARRLSA
jgi:SAM-dependent methyltransferase